MANLNVQDIYAVCILYLNIITFFSNLQLYYQVNDLKFHPVHGTLVTVGSDAIFSCWDKDTRSKLKVSDAFDQPITTCCFDRNGQIFGYSIGYDWSKVSI